MPAFDDAVAAVVGSLQAGEVVSYGEVAAQAGYPGAARAVGGALRRIDGIPWWRVVGHDGRLVSPDPARQARLLRREDVALDGLRVVPAARRGGRPKTSAGDAA